MPRQRDPSTGALSPLSASPARPSGARRRYGFDQSSPGLWASSRPSFGNPSGLPATYPRAQVARSRTCTTAPPRATPPAAGTARRASPAPTDEQSLPRTHGRAAPTSSPVSRARQASTGSRQKAPSAVATRRQPPPAPDAATTPTTPPGPALPRPVLTPVVPTPRGGQPSEGRPRGRRGESRSAHGGGGRPAERVVSRLTGAVASDRSNRWTG